MRRVHDNARTHAASNVHNVARLGLVRTINRVFEAGFNGKLSRARRPKRGQHLSCVAEGTGPV